MENAGLLSIHQCSKSRDDTTVEHLARVDSGQAHLPDFFLGPFWVVPGHSKNFRTPDRVQVSHPERRTVYISVDSSKSDYGYGLQFPKSAGGAISEGVEQAP